MNPSIKKGSNKKQNNILCLFVIILLFIICGSTVTNAASDITVNINGQPLQSDVSPILLQGRTMVPMRAIFEALGASVQWDGSTEKITGTKGNTVVVLHLNNKLAFINGVEEYLDVTPILISGRTMVPTRVIAESFGADVGWDNNTRTVSVNLIDNTVHARVEVKFGTTSWFGGTYVGNLKNGIPNGSGTLTWPNGDIYVGDWVDGQRTGKGMITWTNGHQYIGDFVNNYRTGTGTYTWTNGDYYIGGWKDNNQYGQGTHTWSNGSKYVGSWINGKQHGFGIEYDSNGQLIATGIWENGTLAKPVKPNAPTGLWAKAISSSEIQIGWNNITGTDYYYVYYGYSFNGPYSAFTDSSGNKAKQYLNGLTATGISSGTTSYYKVTAVKNGIESDYSTIVSATTSSAAPAPIYPSLPTTRLHLVAEDGTYLGKLITNKFDTDSIFNDFGTYGNKFSSKSIWNEFGTYGSKFSSQSSFNDFTSTPPYIITSDGKIAGRLTTNKFVSGAISPYAIYSILLELGL